MAQSNKIKFIAEGMKWRDKMNDNTYHSVRITRVDTGEEITCPMTYGDDDHYRQTALRAMVEAGWITGYDRKTDYLYERENNYPIHWTCSYGFKSEVIAHGGE